MRHEHNWTIRDLEIEGISEADEEAAIRRAMDDAFNADTFAGPIAITLRAGPPLRIRSAIAYQDHTDPPKPNECARDITARVLAVLRNAGFVVTEH